MTDPKTARQTIIDILCNHGWDAMQYPNAVDELEQAILSYASDKDKRITQLEAEVERLKKDVNTLNDLLRDKGFGQGEIDNMADVHELEAVVTSLKSSLAEKNNFIRIQDEQKVWFHTQLASLKQENERLKKAEKSLDDQLAIQLAEPSIKTDGYMAGLVNGMLLAKANFGGDYTPISYKDAKTAQLQLENGVKDEAIRALWNDSLATYGAECEHGFNPYESCQNQDCEQRVLSVLVNKALLSPSTKSSLMEKVRGLIVAAQPFVRDIDKVVQVSRAERRLESALTEVKKAGL